MESSTRGRWRAAQDGRHEEGGAGPGVGGAKTDRRWGRFCELGRTLVEEAAGGAATEDMLVFIWAMGGEPPVDVEDVVDTVDVEDVEDWMGLDEVDTVEVDTVDVEDVEDVEDDEDEVDTVDVEDVEDVEDEVDTVDVEDDTVDVEEEAPGVEYSGAEGAGWATTACEGRTAVVSKGRMAAAAGRAAEASADRETAADEALAEAESAVEELRKWQHRKRVFDLGG
eukprot:SAG11_NODE_130_length_15497_cov_10.780556_19_plen_225_part_00